MDGLKTPLVPEASGEEPQAVVVEAQPGQAPPVAVALGATEASSSTTVTPTTTVVVVGQVLPVFVGTMPGMPTFRGAVVAREAQTWPFPMLCSGIGHAADDCGLCCYAFCCPTCAAAEISEKIGNKGCCATEACAAQWCAACAVSLGVLLVGNFVFGFGMLCAPFAWTATLAQVRDAHKAVYRLPDDELCCDASLSSHLPSYCLCLDCTRCSVFQQAYFLKHVAKQDLDCCCYNCCCAGRPVDHADATAAALLA